MSDGVHQKQETHIPLQRWADSLDESEKQRLILLNLRDFRNAQTRKEIKDEKRRLMQRAARRSMRKTASA